ncbi:MAG: MEDS domain-containing protein [Proteobacteria bacterium]|nr:MEDS domain-containing protein [Pseudomonadota bacterium]MBU1387399.1 MEDS domain-containing protein [Pseudomonadota bacterium]MBU1541684.1 MEDS domain-containing protein [Pseudomonadota bacterium]MBU2430117.1 MEDS domain-containing protein [Pseudomonadota bacterium]MBU2482012.1 MEDS domain-containing protein [Pseudomonadota bacterium]
MKKDTHAISLGFDNKSYPAGTHMCLIYNDEVERCKIISKFMAGGLKTGEKVAYFVDEISPMDVYAWLEKMDVILPEKNMDEAFTAAEAQKTYCPDGTFIPERMLATLREFYDQSMAQGYSHCRVSGEMGWALKNLPGSDRLMEYESLVNVVVTTHPVTAVCQYDANRFDGAAILKCLEVHPYMIVHGQVVHNPYYITPEEFLKTLPQA